MARTRRVFLFGLTSGGAFTFDVIIFWFVFQKLEDAFVTNMISTCIGSLFNFVIASRYIFQSCNSDRGLRYSLYLIYYYGSITVFSYVIDQSYQVLEVHPLTVKLLLVPLSFSIHYAAIRFIVERWGE